MNDIERGIAKSELDAFADKFSNMKSKDSDILWSKISEEKRKLIIMYCKEKYPIWAKGVGCKVTISIPL